jgi:hypothetical protein
MVIVTGDIHHLIPRARDQHCLPGGQSEVTVCERFLEIVNGAGLRPTIYVSGKIVERECERLSSMCKKFDFEMGGHTYYCYRPFLPYRLSRVLLGLANGPRFFQSFEITKTLRALAEVVGGAIVSWRNHAFREDRNTSSILARHGVLSVSNAVGLRLTPEVVTTRFGRIVSTPVNTPVDHRNLHPDPRYAQTRGFAHARAWTDEILRQVENNEVRGVASVILAHPACMAIEDNMASLEVLAAGLIRYQCLTMRELAEAHLARS